MNTKLLLTIVILLNATCAFLAFYGIDVLRTEANHTLNCQVEICEVAGF